MILQILPSLVRAIGSDDERQALYEELTYELGKKRGRSQRMCLYDPVGKCFPVGLLQEAESALRSRGIPVARNDLRSRPGGRRGLGLGWLLPHQRAAVEAAIRAVVGCIDVPTAGGKGEIIPALTMELPIRWLVLVDDGGGLHQLGDPLGAMSKPKKGSGQKPEPCPGRIAKRSGEDPGIIGDGIWQADRRVTVASPATLHQHWDGNRWSPQAKALLDSVEGILYDEVQQSGSPRSQLILRSLPRCVYRVGLSATVGGRSDNRDAAVRAQFGPVVYRVPAAELEAQGIIAESRVLMIRCDQPGALHYDGGGYQRSVSLSKERNALVAEVWRRKKTGILTFVRDLDHGAYLQRVADHLGVRAVFVSGEHDSEQRKAAIARFERGELDVLICSKIFKQNTDIIHAYWCVNAAGGRSSIEAIQRKGRGGRICRTANCARCAEMGKKTSVVVYDFYDQDPDAEAARKRKVSLPGLWLRRHAEGRRRAFEDKGMSVTIVGIGEI
jgi:superfamily II DNA or RNA helicase